jgi:hypothetical protein
MLIKFNWNFTIEANPIMRWVMQNWGMGLAYVIRILIPAIFVPIFFVAREKYSLVNFLMYFLLACHIILMMFHAYNILG